MIANTFSTGISQRLDFGVPLDQPRTRPIRGIPAYTPKEAAALQRQWDEETLKRFKATAPLQNRLAQGFLSRHVEVKRIELDRGHAQLACPVSIFRSH